MNRVIHFEFGVTDPARAMAFYTNVFGWEIKPWDGPAEYWQIMSGPFDRDGINGGFFRRTPSPRNKDGSPITSIEESANFNVVITIDDVDAYEKRVLDQGGSVVSPKRYIPGIGWLVYVEDPDNNVFGLLQVHMPDAK